MKMWLSRVLLLIVIAVSVAATTTDVPEEEVQETAESQRQARYAKNDRPLLLIRPVQVPPKAHASAGSSLASTLTSFLPKLNFDWDFLGGKDKRHSPPTKVHYKILQPTFKKEPKEPKDPFISKAVPLSQLHTAFKADYESMQHKKKYPAYNPKPIANIHALPLKRNEAEPVMILPKIPHHQEPVHTQFSDIIVGKPSSDGVNIPPHIEATFIENNKGAYKDLTGEIKVEEHERPPWEWNLDQKNEKLEVKPLPEPYKFDFGGHDILMESKPISLSPGLLPKEHFKFNRGEEPNPTISESVINIVNPPRRTKESHQSDKVSFAPGDAINIVQAPSKKTRKDNHRKQTSHNTESGKHRQSQVHTKDWPKFASSTPPTREFHQKDIDFIHHRLPSPQALKSNVGNVYEVVEDNREDHKNPFIPEFQRSTNSVGDIEKYMEDARKMYLAANIKEAHKYTVAIYPTTPQPKNFHKHFQREEEVEIITQGSPPTDFELPYTRNHHQSEKKGRVYQDREERYFLNVGKDSSKDAVESVEVDDYFLPKREPVYNKFFSTAAPPTSPSFNFRPSASISFGEEDGRTGHFETLEETKVPHKQSDELDFWPPHSKGTSGYNKFFDHEEKPSLSYLPEFVKATVKTKNATKHFSSNKPHQDPAVETADTLHPPKNFNFFPGSNNYLPPTEDFKTKKLSDEDISKMLLKEYQSRTQFAGQGYSKDTNYYDHYDNHNYESDEGENIIPLTEAYPKDYKTIHEKDETIPSSTPSIGKVTAAALQEFKDGLKNRSPKPTFFIKITTTSPPLFRRPNPTSISCERRCIQTTVTQEYLPVCGSDGRTYSNRGKLTCANNCGKEEITVNHIGSCTPSKQFHR